MTRTSKFAPVKGENKMTRSLVFLILCISAVPSFKPARAQKVLDQQQTLYNGGLSALTLPGYTVWQSFTAGLSGTLTEIDMGFFNDISGDGTLQIFDGQGTSGTLLQTLVVPVIGITQPDVTWNYWTTVNVPVVAGQMYTFNFIPDAATLPNPYGVALGAPDPYPGPPPYAGGVMGENIPSANQTTNFDLVFRTYVQLVPEPASYQMALLAGLGVFLLSRNRVTPSLSFKLD